MNGVARDGYIIKTVGKDIYILGKDSAKQDPVREIKRGIWAHMYERATLFGVLRFSSKKFARGFDSTFPGKNGYSCSKIQSFKSRQA